MGEIDTFQVKNNITKVDRRLFASSEGGGFLCWGRK